MEALEGGNVRVRVWWTRAMLRAAGSADKTERFYRGTVVDTMKEQARRSQGGWKKKGRRAAVAEAATEQEEEEEEILMILMILMVVMILMITQGRRAGEFELKYTVEFDDGDRKLYRLSEKTPHVEACYGSDASTSDGRDDGGAEPAEVSPRRLRGRGGGRDARAGGDGGAERDASPAPSSSRASWRAELKRTRS